jgi:hypothetical protein
LGPRAARLNGNDVLAPPLTPSLALTAARLAIDKERFVNARAEDFWTLRERFEQGEIEIDPDDDKLAAQLGSIKWGIDSDQGVVTGRGTISATLLRREHFH